MADAHIDRGTTRAQVNDDLEVENAAQSRDQNRVNRQGSPTGRWPERLGFDVGFASAQMDWGAVDFADPYGPLQMRGATMRLDSAQAFGLEFGLGYTGDWMRARMGLGWYRPTHSDRRLPDVGPNTQVSRVTMSRWFLEFGFARRFGDLTPYVMLHAALLRALAELEGPSLTLRGRNLSIGPRAGVRAHLVGMVYVQADVFADLVNLGDHTITIGLGIGQR